MREEEGPTFAVEEEVTREIPAAEARIAREALEREAALHAGGVTRRIDDDFGVFEDLDHAPPSSRGALARAASDHASTARWPPARGRPGRPRFPDTLVAWAEDRDEDAPDSLLEASVRALADGAAPPANEGARASRPDGADDPSLAATMERHVELVDRLGGLDVVPRSTVASHELRSMGLEHREEFMLSLVDGVSSVSELLECCGLDELDALASLCALADQELVLVD